MCVTCEYVHVRNPVVFLQIFRLFLSLDTSWQRISLDDCKQDKTNIMLCDKHGLASLCFNHSEGGHIVGMMLLLLQSHL